MKPILVIGEICDDVFVTCSITRMCPEAPVPVLNPVSETRNWGMAGNVVANLRSLGAENVETITPEHAIVKTRYVDKQSGYIVMRVDENDEVKTPFDVTELPYLAAFSAVIISDYDKRFLTSAAIAQIAAQANLAGVPTFLDTKKLLGPWSQDITFIKINEREYNAQTAAGIDPLKCCQNLIVTLGLKGSWWVNRDVIVDVEPVEVSSLSGAGDSFLSAFVLKWLINGNRVLGAMDYANRAARIAVSKRGVVSVDWREIV